MAATSCWNGIEFGFATTRKAGIFFERTCNNYVGKLHFATENTQDASEVALSDAKVTINAGGCVGIGTVGPQKLLDVEGDITIGNQDKLYFDGGDNTFICETSGGVLAFNVNGEAVFCSSDDCRFVVNSCLQVGITGTGGDVSFNAVKNTCRAHWDASYQSDVGGFVFTDNARLVLGSGCDAEFYYDGTNLTVNPRVVGTGNFIVGGGATCFLIYGATSKVGIGTSTPAALLHTGSGANTYSACVLHYVNGGEVGMDITDGTVHVATWAGCGVAIAGFGTRSDHDLQFVLGDLSFPVMSFDYSEAGKVGIGTKSPNTNGPFSDCTGLLTIAGTCTGLPRTDNFGVIQLMSPEACNSARLGEIVFVGMDGAGTGVCAQVRIRAFMDGALDSTALAFFTEATGAAFTEKMRITSAGLVGIGTTAPTCTLEVWMCCGAHCSNLILTNDHADGYHSAIEFCNGNAGGFSNARIAAGVEDTGDGYIKFQVGLASTLTDVGYWDSDGNLGLGNASPQAKLDIVGSDAGKIFAMQRAGGGAATRSFGLYIGGLADCTLIFTAGDTCERSAAFCCPILALEATSANVGIGTTAPGFPLTVIGIARFSRADSTPTGTATSVTNDGVFGSTDTANTGITIFGSGQTSLVFGDAAAADIGQVRYQHGSNCMEFFTNSSQAMVIDSSGYTGIGTSAPVNKLHVWGGNAGTDPSWNAAVDRVVFEEDGNLTVQIFTPADATAGYYLSVPGTRNTAGFQVDHSTCVVSLIGCGGTMNMCTGNIGLGTTPSDWSNSTNNITTGADLEIYGGSSPGGLGLGSVQTADDTTAGTLFFVNTDNSDASAATGKVITSLRSIVSTSDSNAGDDSGGDLWISTKPEAGSMVSRVQINSVGCVTVTGNAPAACVTANLGAGAFSVDTCYATSTLIAGMASKRIATGLTTGGNGKDTLTGQFFGLGILGNDGGTDFKSIMTDSDNDNSTVMRSYGGQADTAKSTTALGLFQIEVAEHDGANALSNITSDGNIFVIRAYTGGSFSTKFRVDEDGDGWFGGDLNTVGDVGIGTASPVTSLHVAGDNDTGNIVISSSLASLNNWNGIEFGFATSRKAGIFFERTCNNYVGKLHFATENTQDASEVALSDAKMTINEAGLVGIGRTDPSKLLDLEAAYPEIRFNASAGNSDIITFQEADTNKWQFTYVGGSDLLGFWNTALASYSMVLTDAGNVGIGTAAPGKTLEVFSTTAADYAAAIRSCAADGNGLLITGGVDSGDFALRVMTCTGATDLLSVKGSGDVGIASGDLTVADDICLCGANSIILFDTNNICFSSSALNDISILGTTDEIVSVGIGIAAPEGQLHIYCDNASVAPNTNANNLVIEGTLLAGMSILSTAISAIYFGDSADNDYMYIQAAYNSGDPYWMVCDSVDSKKMCFQGGNLCVSGNVNKAGGTFTIDHPLECKKDTHQLAHSFIEGPKADLIYRGVIDLIDGTAEINVDTVSGMTEGTFVSLNRCVQTFTNNESTWDNVRGSITGNVLTIESNDSTSTASISWMVIGERCDQHMMDTTMTDANGRLIVEPECVIEEEEE